MRHNDWPVVRWGVYALLLLYTAAYFSDIAAPGNRPEYPFGWWGWWDQSQYIASSRGLLSGRLTPDAHWYPLGYSILAAPFVSLWPMHGFFFLDLVCLLIAYVGFLLFADRIGVDRLAAVLIFLATTFADPNIRQTWAEPWTSTPNAAVIWGLLACAAALVSGQAAWSGWRLFLLGLLAGSLPLVRPGDAVLSGIVLLFVLVQGWRAHGLTVRRVAVLMLGVALLALPYMALHLRIYGLHPTPYALLVRQIGFDFSRLVWKAYLLLVEPRPWYPDGEGLLARFPWLVFALAEVVLIATPWRRREGQMSLILLATVILVFWSLHFAFVDYLPSNIWRYNLVHYLKWTFPGLGLFAWLFIVRMWRAPRWEYGCVLALVVVLLSFRVLPARAAPDEAAAMVQYPGTAPTWEDAYLREWQFSDSLGPLGPLGARALPDSQGVRVLAQKRRIVGQLTWANGPPQADGSAVRWSPSLALGWPCWLPPYGCRLLSPGP